MATIALTNSGSAYALSLSLLAPRIHGGELRNNGKLEMAQFRSMPAIAKATKATIEPSITRQNKDLYKDLATLIAGSGLAGRTIAINLDAQRTIFPNSPEIAYYKAFAELLEDVKGVCAHFGSKAEFTFDIGTENEYNAGQLYAGARDDSREMFNLFAEKLSFARAREHARLQVADLIAYEGMKEMDNKIGPVKRPMRKSWAALSGTRRFQAIGYSWEWFKDLRRKLPELEKRSGINQQAYVQWLKERNRQHSISNMVHFTNWKAEQDRKRGV